MDGATPFDAEPYVSLESFKRDGNGVKTPVWIAPLEGRLVVFTLGDSYKVKRIQRNPRVRLAACDVRGKVRGPWHDGTALLVDDPALEARAYQALRKKYGLTMRIGDFFSWLSGRMKKRRIIVIDLEPAP